MLLGSIGATATFEAGTATIATNHPAAGGLTGTFTVATGSYTWNLAGDILPNGATTVATFVHEIPPTAASLADVDAMVAGTKTTIRQPTPCRSWISPTLPPATTRWTTRFPGVRPASGSGRHRQTQRGRGGKYSFAVASDDGARLRIDLDKNGITAADNVIVNDVAQGHTPKYADVTFAAAGTYDFEVTSFNSGGGGDLEFSVSTQANGGDTSAISSGSWDSWARRPAWPQPACQCQRRGRFELLARRQAFKGGHAVRNEMERLTFCRKDRLLRAAID